MNNEEQANDEMLPGDPSEVDATTDNNQIAGMTPDPRRPDTGAEQRNIDGSAMYDWQKEKNVEQD